MPELPEVETTKLGIRPHVVDQNVQNITIRDYRLRWPVNKDLPHLLAGQRLQGIGRRGKYLLFYFEPGVLLWHLGMSGSLRIVNSDTAPQLHDHIDVNFFNGKTLRFHDPRRFGAVVWTDDDYTQHPLIAHLGPEPLSDDFSDDYLFRLSRKRQQAVKSWIMDSKVVVGVGNIYANESLFGAGIHPLKAAQKVSRQQYQRLTQEIKSVLSTAIKRGGTTLRDFVGGDGKPGYFAQELKVYGRGGENCHHCGKPLLEKRIGQRSTVYCTRCQR